jgi:methylated-DNA-[protein]-cysteine S-methyltransferase
LNWKTFKSPLGWVGLASESDAITDVLLPRKDRSAADARLPEFAGAQPGSCDVLESLAEELTRYFNGERVDLSVYSTAPKNPTPFRSKVWAATSEIPYGSTLTYAQVAALVGCPGGSRAVGGALNANPLPIIVPCHRVVSSGGLGGFSAGPVLKRELLQLERR